MFSNWVLYFVAIVSDIYWGGVEAISLTQGLKNIEKNTYVVFGPGRRSERELPICDDNEACNIAHHRLWLTSITERLCRCRRRSECPLIYNHRSTTNDSQDVSNRSQLKFCEGLDESLKNCNEDELAIKITQDTVKVGDVEDLKRRTHLVCKCPWPNSLVINETTHKGNGTVIHTYVCKQLPRCRENDTCGYITKETFELYYTCSCSIDHLCLYREPRTTTTISHLLHFQGEAYEATCLHK